MAKTKITTKKESTGKKISKVSVVAHPIVRGIFLAQLILSATIGIVTLLSSLLVNKCVDTNCLHSTPDYTSMIVGIIFGVVSISALVAWLKKHRPLSVKIYQIYLLTLSLGIFSFWIWGISQYPSFSDFVKDFSSVGLYAAAYVAVTFLPISSFAFVTHYKKQILEGDEPTYHHPFMKAFYITQLVLIILISIAPSPISIYDVTILWTLIAIINIFALLAWMMKNRAASLLMSQVGLVILTLLNASDIFYVATTIYKHPEALSLLLPFYDVIWLIAIVGIPASVLYFITHYHKQIIES